MVITPHALVGAAVGRRLSVPAAILAGLGTHYLLDRIPHRDYPLRAGGGAALALDAAIAASSLRRQPASALAGAVAGILPDLLLVAARRWPVGAIEAHRRLHEANHTTRRCSAALEVATQVAAVGLAAVALGRAGRRS